MFSVLPIFNLTFDLQAQFHYIMSLFCEKHLLGQGTWPVTQALKLASANSASPSFLLLFIYLFFKKKLSAGQIL